MIAMRISAVPLLSQKNPPHTYESIRMRTQLFKTLLPRLAPFSSSSRLVASLSTAASNIVSMPPLKISSTSSNEDSEERYVPPKVWKPSDMGGKFGGINQPTAGARFEKDLPKGRHPLQLYSMGTPNGQKVTIFLEELLAAGKYDGAAEYDAWLVNIFEGDQFGSGFVGLNPNSKIPALVDSEGNRMFESGSILLQLSDKFDNAFCPDRLRGEVLNWVFWQMGSAPYLGGGFGHFYEYAPVKMKYPIDRFTQETKRQLDVLEKRLAETRKYVAGDEYTIADMAIWPWYGSLALGNLYSDSKTFLNVDEEYPHVVAWAEEVARRPAVRRGSMVNRLWGDKSEQLWERHDASDFDTRTADKLEAADGAAEAS